MTNGLGGDNMTATLGIISQKSKTNNIQKENIY